MNHRHRVAVIGTGFIGPVHVEALRRLGIDVVGVLGSSPERALPKARQMGIERVYATIHELVSDDALEAVHITSPNRDHYPQAKAALEAGKHVICEKPFTVNSQESAELLALARSKRLVHAVNFNNRFYPLNQHARELVRNGELGRPYMVRGYYVQDHLLFDTDWNWRFESSLAGELRTVGDIGSHWLDLTSFITGLRIERVFADLQTFIEVRRQPIQPLETFASKSAKPVERRERRIENEDYATVLLHYEGGARGAFTVSQMCAGRKNLLAYEINGEKQSLAWNAEQPNALWLGFRDTPNRVAVKDPALLSPAAAEFADYPGGHTEGYPDTFKQLYKAIYRYIEAGDFDAPPDFPTFADGHEGMLLVEAIAESARRGEWVEVERTGGS